MYIQMKIQKIKDTLYFKLEGRNKVLIRDDYWINLELTLATRQFSHQGKNIKWMLLLQGAGGFIGGCTVISNSQFLLFSITFFG